ncbi:MAG: AraC family transcriptional regulator [Hyphomonadaceae bacterium]|nr:AraC family transcriptional regulator [Hyphomonadaceae bacterium]
MTWGAPVTVESAISLKHAHSGAEFPSAPTGSVVLSTAASGWRTGLVLEVQRIAPLELPEHGLMDHRLMVNLGGPTRFGVRRGGRIIETVLPTAGFSLQSAGDCNAPFWRDELTLAAVAIEPALVARLLEERAPPPSRTFRETRHVHEPQAYAYARSIAAELATPTEPLWAETLSLSFTLYLLGRYGDGGAKALAPRGKLAAAQLSAAVELARASLGEGVSLDDLAAAAGLSSFHFARLFKATTGEAPHRWVHRLRIERAVRLLKAKTPVAEVALAAGFYDQAHMTNAFKKAFGRTPGAVAAD